MMDAYDPRTHSHPHQFDPDSHYAHQPQHVAHAAYGAYYTQPRALPSQGSLYGAIPASTDSSAHSSPNAGAFIDDAAYAPAAPAAVGSYAMASGTQQQLALASDARNGNAMQASGSRSHSHSHSHSYSLSSASGSSSNSSPAGGPSPLPSAHAPSSSSTSLSTLPNSSSSAMANGTPLSRPLTHKETELLSHLDRLKFFLITAPSRWADAEALGDESTLGLGSGSNGGASKVQQGTPMMPHPNTHPALNRFLLPSGEYVTCVLWSGLYHITGTDIVRALVFRFEAFGRPVRNMKKFEEGVFSDLRNLKPGTDACLEEPKSPFLDLLFKYQCIRTQKKQKVFYWFSVPHDRLFLDALERDLKREKMGLEPTTHVVGEPALSFTYDSKRTLYEQFSKAQGTQEGEGELETAVRRAEEAMAAEREARPATSSGSGRSSAGPSSASAGSSTTATAGTDRSGSGSAAPGTPFFNMFSLFEGSPSYKQRRKKGPRVGRSALARDSTTSEDDVPGNNAGRADSIEDIDGEMSAAELFDAQASLGAGAGTQVQAQRQADNQRLVQAQHLAALTQRAGGVAQVQRTRPQNGGMYDQQQLQLPGRAMHPSLAAVQGQSQRPNAEARHTYPLLPAHDITHTHMSSLTTPTLGASVSGTSTQMLSQVGARKTKAYACPLYSCQQLFKRLEHLKRHVRKHTLERPYQCELCQRRFSRADNLNQHMRTHNRDGLNAGTAPDAAMLGAPNETEEDGVDQVLYAPNAQYDLDACEVEVSEHANVQFEDDDVSKAYRYSSNSTNGYYGLAGGDVQQFANIVASPENSPQMTASQLQGDWSAHANSLPAAHSVGYDYNTSSHPSPAFSTASAPSMQARYATSYGTPATGAYQIQSDYSPTSFSAPSSAGSLSAPAHKQTFDHAALYPTALGLQGLVNGQASGTGPVRRYRSATPTIARVGEHIRRPATANTLDGSPLASGSTRGYHPYAHPQYPAAAATGSAHSSPAPYQAQLEYTAFDRQPHGLAHQSQSTTHGSSSSDPSAFQDGLQSLIGLSTMGPALGGYETTTATSIAASGAAYTGVYADGTQYATPDTTTAGYYANMASLDSTGQYNEQYRYDVSTSGN
ncbi:hypothetical protein M0805_009386 [Coniferiporia weirii]|nr:hypothetical protein M0805_009386 [Coniferiporia weirii]